MENTTTEKQETTLGNGLTNGQKWALLIGLTLGAWYLLHLGEKNN